MKGWWKWVIYERDERVIVLEVSWPERVGRTYTSCLDAGTEISKEFKSLFWA